jgi:ketosteroid isomerase-like protein
MKLIFPALLLAPLLACASPQDELLKRDALWNEYRLKSDARSLAPLLADDWMLTHSDGKVQYKKDYLEQLGTGNRVNTAITNEDVRVRMYGDTAVVTGASTQSGVGDGKPFSGSFRFTRVWILRGGAWVMTASHSSRLP